jgi:hypothetical protein
MHQLESAYNSDEFLFSTIQNLSERIRGNACKLGLILDLHPFWEFAHRLERSGLDPMFPYRYEFDPFTELTGDSMSEPVDLSRKYHVVEYANEYAFGTEKKKKNTPYLLRIYSRPVTDASMSEMRQSLVEAARATDIATVVETHTPGRLLAGVGDEIHQVSGKKGTLGGYVTDTVTGDEFAMTCGHVLDNSTSVALFRDKHGAQVGHPHLKDRIVPAAHPTGTPCDVNCATATALDVALVDVTGSGPRNLATGIDAVVAKRDLVTMYGANGRETYEIGPWVVDLEIGGRCFVRLMQFHAPLSSSMLHRSVAVATTRLPTGGDSGSWLLNNSNEWSGMVVAADHLHGYAIAASTLLPETGTAIGRDLALL